MTAASTSPTAKGSSTSLPRGCIEVDRNGFEILGRDECLRLLASARLGRVGITSGALPVILPVNFRLIDDEIVFRTARGTKLDAATQGAVVAFEVDAMDPFDHTGWSVLVTGVARPIDIAARGIDPGRIARWAPSGDCSVVAVSTEMISGRRLR
jgi:hypothetical protein